MTETKKRPVRKPAPPAFNPPDASATPEMTGPAKPVDSPHPPADETPEDAGLNPSESAEASNSPATPPLVEAAPAAGGESIEPGSTQHAELVAQGAPEGPPCVWSGRVGIFESVTDPGGIVFVAQGDDGQVTQREFGSKMIQRANFMSNLVGVNLGKMFG